MTTVDKLEGLLDGVYKAAKQFEITWDETNEEIRYEFYQWAERDGRLATIQNILSTLG